jgi:hypothetical protein
MNKRYLANVRVRQKSQVHIQGMTSKYANEDVSGGTFYFVRALSYSCCCDPEDDTLAEEPRAIRPVRENRQTVPITSLFDFGTFSTNTPAQSTRPHLHQLFSTFGSSCLHRGDGWDYSSGWPSTEGGLGNDKVLSSVFEGSQVHKR